MFCDVVDYIVETFAIVRCNGEQWYGEYWTKQVFLEIYDAIQVAMALGERYRARLDPTPAEPVVVIRRRIDLHSSAASSRPPRHTASPASGLMAAAD